MNISARGEKMFYLDKNITRKLVDSKIETKTTYYVMETYFSYGSDSNRIKLKMDEGEAKELLSVLKSEFSN